MIYDILSQLIDIFHRVSDNSPIPPVAGHRHDPAFFDYFADTTDG